MTRDGPTQSMQSLALRERVALASLPVSTGAAVLVMVLVSRASLLWPALVLVMGTGISAVVVARRLEAETRQRLGRRVKVGVVAGVAATAAYDLVRYGVVTLFSWSVDPFKTFPLFGRLLLGAGASAGALWVAGTAYHVINGLGFAVGYTLVISRPGLLSAVVWALVLETFTILLYPDWLGLTAIGEFFSMSMPGHLAYGVVLGFLATRMAPGAGQAARSATVTP